MFITLVVILCSTLPGPELCEEQVVTDSSMSEITWQGCQYHAQIGIAEWKARSIKYRENWEVESYRCYASKYQVRSKA